MAKIRKIQPINTANMTRAEIVAQRNGYIDALIDSKASESYNELVAFAEQYAPMPKVKKLVPNSGSWCGYQFRSSPDGKGVETQGGMDGKWYHIENTVTQCELEYLELLLKLRKTPLVEVEVEIE